MKEEYKIAVPLDINNDLRLANHVIGGKTIEDTIVYFIAQGVRIVANEHSTNWAQLERLMLIEVKKRQNLEIPPRVTK